VREALHKPADPKGYAEQRVTEARGLESTQVGHEVELGADNFAGEDIFPLMPRGSFLSGLETSPRTRRAESRVIACRDREILLIPDLFVFTPCPHLFGL
jgi:hypothetical protein